MKITFCLSSFFPLLFFGTVFEDAEAEGMDNHLWAVVSVVCSDAPGQVLKVKCSWHLMGKNSNKGEVNDASPV